MVFFDYLFYRLAIWFYRGDGSSASRAMIAVSVMQFVLLLPWFLFIICWFVGTARAQKHQSAMFAVVILLWVLCAYANKWRYQNRFEELVKRWQQEKGMSVGLKTLGVLVAFFASFYLSYRIATALPY